MGNSLIRDMMFSQEDFEEVIILPGATLDRLFEEVMATPYIANCLVYLVEGPIRYSDKISTRRRHEAILKEEVVREWDEEIPIQPGIVEQLSNYRGQAVRRGIQLVIPTMSLLHFGKYNYVKGRGTRCNRNYIKWQNILENKLREDNGKIVGSNRNWSIHTPFLNKGTLESRGRSSNTQVWDGLHPTSQLRRKWERELLKNVDLNKSKWDQRLN